MTHEEGAVGDHVVDDEPLHVVASGRFVDDATDRPVSIGLTDRRMLCAFDEDEFAAISYDGICSVRSRQYTKRTVRGNDSRLLIGAGGYLAVNALFGLVVYAFLASPVAGATAIVLALVTVVGVAAGEGVRRRHGYGMLLPKVDTGSRATAHDRTTPDPSGGSSRSNPERSPFGDIPGTVRKYRNADSTLRREGVVTAGGALAGAIGGLAFLTLIAYVSIVVVPALVLVSLGGLALVDYGTRHESDGIELVRKAETEVAITTVDGNTFTIVVDADLEIDGALNGLAFADGPGPKPAVGAPAARDPSEAGTPSGSSS